MMCHIRVVLIWGFIAVYLHRTVLSETRLCSQCRSAHQAECATNPPTPAPCPEGATYCSIIREKKMNGEPLGFHRGCTTVMTQECVTRPVTNITACYSTCDTDGCNHANSISTASLTFILIPTLSYLVIGYC